MDNIQQDSRGSLDAASFSIAPANHVVDYRKEASAP